ncbi:MAG TPA: AAA family ATPase, partial [Anaerolineales bacterium]|nr:AAA family ATPase [Anaerolineales bacterium]
MGLLERAGELETLAATWDQVTAGSGRVVLVSGEAGIGKTALVEAFVNGASGAPRVLWGVCDALFTPRPFGPLHDLASQLDGRLPALLASDADRSAIFPAMLAELQARPSILVIEDAHWADEATFDLLRYLGRRMQRTRALLIITYRDDELDPKHPLRIVLGDLATSAAVRRMPLAALSLDAVRALAGEQSIDVAALHRQTAGNPFFVTEVLADPSGGISRTVRDAVFARAARLSPQGWAVLRAAAVIGPRIEAWALTEVAGPDAAAVDACLTLGMLGTQGEALAFRHELSRQAVLDTLSARQRQELHRATFAA